MDWRFFEEGDLEWILKVTKDMFEESEWNDGEYDKDKVPFFEKSLGVTFDEGGYSELG